MRHDTPSVSLTSNHGATSSPSEVRESPRVALAAPIRERGVAIRPFVYEPPPAAGSQPGPGQTRVTGTVVVIDEDRCPHAGESGSLMALYTNGKPYLESVAVPVQEGRWTIDLPTETRIEFGALLLGGRKAWPERSPVEITGPRAIEINATWIPRTSLRVVDRDSGLDLDGVDLVRGAGYDRFPAGEWKPDALALGARSPFMLPEALGFETYWVRASGHAWGYIEVDHRSGGERMLMLDRACELAVYLINHDPRVRSHLKLVWISGRPKAEPIVDHPPADDGPTIVRDLPPGRYEVVIGRGDAVGRPTLVLGKADVTLTPEQRGEVAITLSAAPSPSKLVPLSGTLVMPAAWGDPPARIVFAPAGAAFPGEWNDSAGSLGQIVIDLAAAPGERVWKAGRVAPGRYHAIVETVRFQRTFEVGTEGATAIRIEIPEPAEVTAQVVDAATNAEIPVKCVTWNAVEKNESFESVLGTAERDPKSKLITFRAPAGSLEISFFESGWMPAGEQVFEVHPGPNLVRVEALKACGFSFVLMDGEARVPASLDTLQVTVEEIGGPGKLNGITYADGAVETLVSRPGRYRVTVGSIDGFKPLPELIVEVHAGEVSQVVVPLTRKK